MLATDKRSGFILRDPSALEALLDYDWRARRILTDEEALEQALGQESDCGLLRHLQRLGFIRALHGVRPQGGRMRLWRLEDVMKIQIAMDLSHVSGKRISASVEALDTSAPMLECALAGWERHVGAPPPRGKEAPPGAQPGVLADAAALEKAVQASIRDFVARNRFDAVERPAFLL